MNEKNYKTIYEFLDKHKINKNSNLKFTHTSVPDKKNNYYAASYHIPNELKEYFLELYTKWVFSHNVDLFITEAHHPNLSCVLIDLDFRHANKGVVERKYCRNDLLLFLKKYLDVLKTVIEIPVEKCEAFLLEKSQPIIDSKDKKIIKDGTHIMFPYIVTEYPILYHVREQILKDKELIDLFNNIGCTNDITDIVDKAVIEKNNWFMYGSKKPLKEPYVLTGIYNISDLQINSGIISDNTEKNLISQKKFKDLELVKIMSVNLKENLQDASSIKDRKIIDDYYSKKEGKSLEKVYKMKPKYISTTKENLGNIRNLISILNPDRANTHQEWIRVGWCLHNIDYNLLNDWIKFSQQSHKFEEGCCEAEWIKMENKGLSIGSLHRWAKEDNPKEYKNIMSRDIRTLIQKSLSGVHGDVSPVVYQKFRHDFRCVSSSKKIWYVFENHRWREVDDAIPLKKKIMKELVTEYIDFSSYCNLKAMEPNVSEDERETYLNRSNAALKITSKLKDMTYLGHLIKASGIEFFEEKFIDKLDSNVNLIGFNNGVYDLEKGEFRDGLCEDYISFSTGIDYEEFEDDHPYITSINEFLDQVLPIENVKKYVLKFLASCLCGKTGDEKFHIWTGCHAKGSKILLHNGTIKNVEDIVEKDLLMGPDSKARKITKLIRGNSKMYKVKPSKGEDFIINEDHILALKATNIGSIMKCKKENRIKVEWQEKDEEGYPVNKCTNFPYKTEKKKIYRENVKYYENELEAENVAINYRKSLIENRNVIKDGDIIEIPLKEYLKRIKKIGSRNYYLFKVGVKFDKRDVSIDPYALGYWLGDGNSNNFGITTMDSEIVEYFDKITSEYNMDKKTYNKSKASTINYSSKEKTKGKNVILNNLRKYNLLNNKHIPEDYKINDESVRYQVLAGIIDSDGHYNERCNQYELTLKSEKLIDDTLYLIRSLGISGTKKIVSKKSNTGKIGQYYQIIFYGENIINIPVKLERKIERINKDNMRYGFKLEELENDDYYGFQISDDHLYLTGDFMVHHNCGGNGKSKLIELFEMGFGDYCGKMPVTQITQKRPASNACTPEVVKNKGKRFVTLQEPDNDEHIHVGSMKELTGGDTISGRGLFKDAIEFKPQWHPVMTANHLPGVNGANDRGTWRRLLVTEFVSTFLPKSEIDPEKEYQFPIDYDLTTKLKEWPEAFIFMLLKEYKKYLKDGLVEPQEILRNTDTYKQECDCFLQFINEVIVKDPLHKQSVKEAFDFFNQWYKQSGNKQLKIKRKDFMDNISKLYGNPVNSKFWKGIRIVTHSMDDVDDEED